MKKPTKIVILSTTYTIKYYQTMLEVDPERKDESYGHIDGVKRIINIYDGGRPPLEIMLDLMHEILHAIAFEMGGPFSKEKHHADLNRLSIAIVDTLQRNGMIKLWPK